MAGRPRGPELAAPSPWLQQIPARVLGTGPLGLSPVPQASRMCGRGSAGACSSGHRGKSHRTLPAEALEGCELRLHVAHQAHVIWPSGQQCAGRQGRWRILWLPDKGSGPAHLLV